VLARDHSSEHPPPTRQVFERVYREHRQAVLRWCLRYGAGSQGWAEDVTQEVFLRLHQHLGELDLQTDLQAWLYRTTANLAISRFRRETSLWSKVARVLSAEPERTVPGAEEIAAQQQAGSDAWKAFEELEGPARVVLSMKLLDGKSQKEIAAELGLSKGYVSKLVARAWKHLEAQGWEVSR
jgi:RNA polymerase sigma factor (sigma-70 family)